MKSILITLVLIACTTSQKDYESYGEPITDTDALAIESLIQEVTDQSQTFKVRGTIEEVCQMKGCWMTLRNESNANIRVTFKDYGFFVPKDISGSEVVIEGTAMTELLDEDVARHYAEDGGVEYQDSMRNAISFVAHGVLVAKS